MSKEARLIPYPSDGGVDAGYSHIIVPDSIGTYEEYRKKAVEYNAQAQEIFSEFCEKQYRVESSYRIMKEELEKEYSAHIRKYFLEDGHSNSEAVNFAAEMRAACRQKINDMLESVERELQFLQEEYDKKTDAFRAASDPKAGAFHLTESGTDGEDYGPDLALKKLSQKTGQEYSQCLHFWGWGVNRNATNPEIKSAATESVIQVLQVIINAIQTTGLPVTGEFLETTSWKIINSRYFQKLLEKNGMAMSEPFVEPDGDENYYVVAIGKI